MYLIFRELPYKYIETALISPNILVTAIDRR